MYFNEDFDHCDEVVYNDINKHMVNLYKCGQSPDFLPFIEKQINHGGKLYFEHEDAKRNGSHRIGENQARECSEQVQFFHKDVDRYGHHHTGKHLRNQQEGESSPATWKAKTRESVGGAAR